MYKTLRVLIDEFRTANKRGGDRFTSKEFADVVKVLELGFDGYGLGELFAVADTDKTGLASLLSCVTFIFDFCLIGFNKIHDKSTTEILQ